jgi:hypothetical protein
MNAARQHSHSMTSRACSLCLQQPRSSLSNPTFSPRLGALANIGTRVNGHSPIFTWRMPSCRPAAKHTLRLFVAEELFAVGVTPCILMEAQGFDPATLDLLKFNPDQARVAAGNGRESGQWTSSDATVTPVSFRTRARTRALSTLLEWLRSRFKGSIHKSPPEKAPSAREERKPKILPRSVDSAMMSSIFS